MKVTWWQNAALAAVAAVTVAAVAWTVTRDVGVDPSLGQPLPELTLDPLPTPSLTPVVPLTRPRVGPLRFAVLGDSLSSGHFAARQEQGFVPIVQRALGGDGAVQLVPVRNSRRAGELTVIDQFLGFAPRADLVIVELGTNDYNTDTVSQFTAQYARLVGQVRSASPRARLVCLGVWHGSERTSSKGGAQPSYDAAVRTACEAAGGSFVRLAGIFNAEGTRGPKGAATWAGPDDGFHPNTKGHAAIAEAIMQTVG